MRSGTSGGCGPKTKEEVEEPEARRPWEDSGRALRPERPGPGDQPKGDAPRAMEMQRPPRGSRDRCRKPWVTPGPARAPTAEPPFTRRGCDSAVKGPEGRGLRGERLCTAPRPG